MRILALDIGAATEDVLLYDEGKKSVENCVKMVLPCASQVYAEKVRVATRLGKHLSVRGDVIGGGAFASALIDHIKEGLQVFMTETTAYTVRNNLSLVRDLGIEIASETDPLGTGGVEEMFIEEVNVERLRVFLADFGEDLFDIDVAAVAVQDHGVSPKGMSNRKFRIQKMRELLEDDQKAERLAFLENEIPTCFLRMRSAARACRRQLTKAKVLVMDTALSAILGCLCDISVDAIGHSLAVNVGNGHTIAALVSGGGVAGLVEHHTESLNTEKIERVLVDFADGRMTDEEVFGDGGHGCFLLEEPPGFSNIEEIVATGPNRRILEGTNLNVRHAAPAGDVMMTGPLGLVEATKRRLMSWE